MSSHALAAPCPHNDDADVDVIVIGGGPGGSTVATLTAKAGRKVLLLEREKFPRYQIGESLLPATVHGIAELLDVRSELEQASFVRKRGGSFRWGVSPEPWNFLFGFSPRLSGPTSDAYQVERAKFDDILLRNAERHGVQVREQAAVKEIIADAERVRGVRYVDADGREREVSARFVVDASGGRSSLHRAVGEHQQSEYFRNHALFGYFHGGKRLPGPDAGNILCAAFDEGWFWYIPLSDELTSVGAVVDARSTLLRGDDREAVLMGLIDRCDRVRDMLSEATRVTEGMYGELRIRRDYSYLGERFWKPGMILVGDAACFIDPVFSTGVHLATYSALLAARSINSIIDDRMSEDRALAEFEGRYRREYAVFYEFLSAFYQMDQGEDTYFWQARKSSALPMSDMEAFTTLVAGVSSGEAALGAVSEAPQRLADSAKELAGAVARTGPMQTESGERMFELFGTRVVQDVMEEMNQVQSYTARQAAGVNEQPLLPGGLVVAGAGLHWAEPDGAVGQSQ